MGTRKKATELVFNLQWRNKPDNGGDKSNVIGMYDTPATTSNFEMFKSYLLKNSGVAGNDVKVTYLTDNGQEWVIDSQEWFEIALSAFRLKARLGEVIFLKLAKISSSGASHQMARKHSNDVETQFDVDSMGNSVDTPPEWFVTYMKQFKRDVVEEVTFAVSSNIIASSKDKECPQIGASSSKKIKPESSKRSRKHLVLGETPIDKEFLKTFKFDRKLEIKLDKLDAKSKKIKEKKQALIGKIDGDESRHNGRFSHCQVDEFESFVRLHNPTVAKKRVEEVPKKVSPVKIDKDVDASSGKPKQTQVPLEADGTGLMNGTLVNAVNNTGTHEQMMGGEVYLHTWEVMNSGKLPWTLNTQLRLTWGSADMVPSVKTLRCPPLKPGERGSISVRFEIPKKSGTYESYWNFYDNDVRFGQSLSCCVAVQEPLSPIPHHELFKKPKVEHKPKQIERVLFYETELTKEPLNIPVPKHAERLLYYPNGMGDGSEPVDIHIPKNTDTVLCYPSGEGSKPFIIPSGAVVKFPHGLQNPESRILFFPEGVVSPSEDPNVHKGGQDNGQTPEQRPVYSIKFPVSQNQTQTQENMSTEPQVENQRSQGTVVIEENKPPQFIREGITAAPSSAVIDLSRRIKDMKIAGPPNGDSDSEWESVWSYGKIKNLEENLAMDCDQQKTIKYGIAEKDLIVGKLDDNLAMDCGQQTSNKYGINEKDLIVDLSKSAKEVKPDEAAGAEAESADKDDVKDKASSVKDEDDNNNNGTVDNNNSSGESISEVGSEASDLSSGYDVLNAPVCDEKEDGSGYVYITIDGNKLPVPKHILRPDFLLNAEEAPGPLVSDDEEKPAEAVSEDTNQDEASALLNLEATIDEAQEANPEDPKSFMSHCSTAGTCFSDMASGRLFIFPQNNPGYEVIYPGKPETGNVQDGKEPSMKDEVVTNSTTLSWPNSDSQYTFSDIQNPAHLRTDPYGPLEHSQPPPCARVSPNCPPYYYLHPTSPVQMVNERMTPTEHPMMFHPTFPHVLNYQQSVPKPCSPPTVNKQEVPSAPPQQCKSPDQPTVPSTPVHILPENLVTGAVNVASSAINTARSVINMIVPPKSEGGKWVNGHWVTENPQSLRAKNLCILAEMGFWNADLNATLLARYNDDIARVVSELVQ